jgi:oligopeptide transport system ATP-binding protein
MKDTLLNIRSLRVSFGTEEGKVYAVNDVSIDVARGETLAIVGESGSGKSVTALSVLGLIGNSGRIESGEILFEGENLIGVSARRLREIRGNRISMIFQEPMSSLNPSITIGRQVAEPIRLHRGLEWREALHEAGELLSRVAIPDAHLRLKDYPHQFSGGMRQRVMIAMALACEPKLIIADEPTTALDVTVQAQIMALLRELIEDTGAALILITHDLGVVANYADRVAVMYAGRIVETSSAEVIYKSPRHPYTRGLMASIPSLDDVPGSRLPTIEGLPPDLTRLPEGCAFAPRCKMAQSVCFERSPPENRAEPDAVWVCHGFE